MGDIVNPLVERTLHEGDELLDADSLKQLDLVSGLKSPPDFKKFPGSILLRRYRPGDIVCRQGDGGASAFYILTTNDVVRLRRHQVESSLAAAQKQSPATQTSPALQASAIRLSVWKKDLSDFEARAAQNPGAEKETPCVASARLVFDDAHKPTSRSIWNRWFGSAPSASSRPNPIHIPNDGPTDLDYLTRRAPLHEGEVFGEMSCMTLAPRSATVVVEQPCFMLEFLRNIFDKIQKDAGYRTRMDAVYRQRVLAGHLRRLEILQDVPPSDLEWVGQQCELLVVDPGTVLCDEGDPADCVYLIRSGMVQVVTDTHVRLAADQITNWPLWRQALLAGEEKSPPANAANPPAEPIPLPTISAEKPPPAAIPGLPVSTAKPKKPVGTPPQRVWQELPASVRAILSSSAAQGDVSSDDRLTIVAAVNEIVRRRSFVAAEEFAGALSGLGPIAMFPKGAKGVKKDWSELEVRIAGRILLEAIYPNAIQQREFRGPPKTINYLSRGDLFGEMGVVLESVRSATCVAYDHPIGDGKREPGRVELVRIGRDVFRQLRERSPQFRAKVDAIVRQRQARDAQAAQQSVWSNPFSLLTSPDAQEQGLIQGQKLLLIDLDRCTRCGDCVRACVNTHADGHSRLFLDGPRFDRFLVPSACRKCLNPSCMIGCPVGSIQRGQNGQIEIRDWCIGCGLCATQCPYDSIQMHDVGLLPEHDAQWRVANDRDISSDAWQNRNAKLSPAQWGRCNLPARFNLDLLLAAETCFEPSPHGDQAMQLASPLLLRREFDASPAQRGASTSCRLDLSSQAAGVEVWLNGKPLSLTQDDKQKKKGEYEGNIPALSLFARENVLAVRLSPPLALGQMALSLRLDPVPEMVSTTPGLEASEVKLVTEKAVVCDLCSSLSNQQPACVTSCPHEAAWRVDARFEFPIL